MWSRFERYSNNERQDLNLNITNNTIDVKLPETENISTITGGSFASIECISEAPHEIVYDTDHIDINSEYDEAELRRELLKDQWRSLFDKFDPEGFGEIPVQIFLDALKSPELLSQVPINKRELLYERAIKSNVPHGSGYISVQEFINVMSGKRSHSFKCAVHHRDREVCSENDFHIITEYYPLFKRMVHIIAMEVLPEERDRKYYADHYSCYPPPLFVILVSIIELSFFAYHTIVTGETNPAGPIPVDSLFIYRPDRRQEVWRFLFYMVLHAGWFHLLFNIIVQLLVGLPLEMVHGSLRIGCIYLAGVLAGSLGTSIFDPEVYLVGASGGVYALLTAHLANVMINYNNMQYGKLRIVAIFMFASCDVGFAIYSRYATDYTAAPSVSYVAHLAGAFAGLTIGLLVLKNFEQKLHEQLLWWIALGVYAACIIFAIVYNFQNTVLAQRFEERNKDVIRQHLFFDVGI